MIALPPVPNRKHLRLWVEWLRDPANRQDRNGLRTDQGFCCLGVACELYRTKTGAGNWEPSFTSAGTPAVNFQRFVTGPAESDMSDAALPDPVSNWFGLSEADPILNTVGMLSNPDAHFVGASTLNDNYNWTFAQIADAIEKTFELEKPDAPTTE